MWGPLVVASTLAHVGCPRLRSLRAPGLPLPRNARVPPRPASFQRRPCGSGCCRPPLGWVGNWVCTLAEPGDLSIEWTTVCVAPELRVRYWVGVYTEELGRALHALTHDEWETEPVSAAGGPEDADDGGEGFSPYLGVWTGGQRTRAQLAYAIFHSPQHTMENFKTHLLIF